MTRLKSILLGAAIFALLLSSPLHAAALYFEKTAVKTGSESTCLRFAGDTARELGLTNVHKSSSEVAGEKGGVYVAITCVGRGAQPAIAVVMSVATDFGVAKQLGHLAADKIKRITCIDSPC